MSITLVNPTTSDTQAAFVEAPRLIDLHDARVALLANGKTHGEFLLAGVVARLREQFTLGEVRVWVKPHPSGPPTPAQIAEIREFATVVLSAIGDCGSCSSCSVFDGMNFERMGIPSAIMISRPFLPTAAAIAKLNGADRFRVVAITHPVTSKGEAALLSDAAEATPQIIDVLLRGHSLTSESDGASPEVAPGRESEVVESVLAEFREALSNDGTDIELVEAGGERVTLRLVTSGAACADCVLPVAMIHAMLASELESHFGPGLVVEVSDDRVPVAAH